MATSRCPKCQAMKPESEIIRRFLRKGAEMIRFHQCRECFVKVLARRNRHVIRPKMRRAILKRDGRKCRECSRGAMRVGHILPPWQGGVTEAFNLGSFCKLHIARKTSKAREPTWMISKSKKASIKGPR